MSEKKKETDFEQDIIDNILFKGNGSMFQDLILNTLLSKENKLSQGMSSKDFDLIFSTQEAINKEILHTLIVCPNRYDPESKYCQFVKKEEIKFTEEKYDNFNKLIKNDYKSFKIMLTPRIRRNLIFDITTLNYKIMLNNKVENYKMNHKLNNKDILCLVSHKLKKKPKNPHKFGKIVQILEQLKDDSLKEFWDYYGIVYIIFCVKSEDNMKQEYNTFTKEMKNVTKDFKNVKILFFIESQINKDTDPSKPKYRNIFVYNNYGKNYFFLMSPDYKIYKSDNMLFSGDIVEDSIKLKKKEKEDKTKNQEEIKRERYKAFSEIHDFYTKLYEIKYALYFCLEFEICLKYDINKNRFFISYIDFYKIAADLRPNEYKKVLNWTNILKPEDAEDVREIKLKDIKVDFSNNMCKKCQKTIRNDEPMYYCYKCEPNEKYCCDCVIKHYRNKENVGRKKFIDNNHNLLFFKTRNENSFKNIDEDKLGNDIFNKCEDEKQFENFQRLCYGCKRKFNDSPRYICLNCNKGTLVYGRYHDYCLNCIDHMMKNDEEGKKIQDIEERLYGFETRTLLTNNETYKHNNNEHVYLMIALEIKDKNDF